MNKDLLVLTADADAEAVMNAILPRHQSLGTRAISFDVKRHPMRDSGIFSNGPEFSKLFKDSYDYLLVIWDHHGSGCHSPPARCAEDVQSRLASVSWSDRAGSFVISPELEEWLWRNHASLCAFFRIGQNELDDLIKSYCNKQGLFTPQDAFSDHPKELLDFITRQKQKKGHLLPRDFKKIAENASLRHWQASASFQLIVTTLKKWFP